MNTIAQVKHSHLQLALLSAFALFAAAAGGNAVAANATATATTTVVSPIAITKAVDLAFGNIFASGTAGTVSVDTDGSRTVSGGVTLGSGSGTAAKFDITGTGTMTYGITYASGVTLTGTGAPMALTQVSNLSGAAGAGGLVATGTLTAGAQSLYIGGTLAVGANQTAGSYTANITATVEYN
ncbi:MAG: DUF4402 domain-containing protein [Telluria sp.]